jgi:TniQ
LNLFVEAVPDRPWPLHPRPTEWEDLETWVRRIAEAYGVSYDAFLLNALGHNGSGARDLDHAPIQVLVRLSVGTGIPLNQLREMSTQRVMRRMGHWPGESSEPARGRAALDCLCAMGSRRRRRISANRGF